MGMNFGSGAISAAYLGGAEVSAAYLGRDLLWQRATPTPGPGPGPSPEPIPGAPVALFHYENYHAGSVDDTGDYEGGLFNLWASGNAQRPAARFGTGVGQLILVQAHSGSSAPGTIAITGQGSMISDVCLCRNNGSSIIPPLDLTTFTLECWILPVFYVSAYHGIEYAVGHCNVSLVFVNASDGTKAYSGTSFGLAEGAGFTVDADWSEPRWYHLAYVFDGTNISLYVDGILRSQETDAYLAGMLSNGTFYQMGLRCSAAINGVVYSEFALAIDEVALFDYARYTGNFTPPTGPYSLTTSIQE